MPFEPFGYRFELGSPLKPAEVRAAIRARKKGWFERRKGARGWIIGPVLCLWNSAFDRYGPMLFGWIRRDGKGTRISGRAGSDLNGILMLGLLTPVLAGALIYLISRGEASTGQILVMGGLLLVGLPLALWTNNMDRRGADPLVHFLHRTLDPTRRRAAPSPSDMQGTPAARLLVDGEAREAASADALRDALSAMAMRDSVIIEFAPEIYMQAMARDDHFLVEKREGGADRHFAAKLPKGETDAPHQYDASLERLIDIMTAYLRQQPPAFDLNWTRISP